MGLFDGLKNIVTGGVPKENEDNIKRQVYNTGGQYHKLEESETIFGKLIKFIAFWQKEGEA